MVNATGAINTGIERTMLRLKGREKWMIPAMLLLFAAGGRTYGMTEETRAFYAAASTIAGLFVMRCAGRVREDPTRPVVADMKASNEAYFLKGRDKSRTTLLTGRQQIILTLFALTFAVMIRGVSSQGWKVARALFKPGAATRVIACKMAKSRAAMHLDTVFSFCNRDVLTSLVRMAAQILCFGRTPDDKGGVGHRRETKPLLKRFKF